MIRTYDFEIAGLAGSDRCPPARNAPRPGGLDLGDLAVDDVARQTQHHVFGVTAVQAGLQHQSRAALGTRTMKRCTTPVGVCLETGVSVASWPYRFLMVSCSHMAASWESSCACTRMW